MLFRLIGLTVALGDSVNPITRIAQLLQGLSDKVESDGKAETKLYDDFVCWCKTIESQKTTSNEVANLRITELKAYIDDIENGRVEFTTEREDLVKEISELQEQLEQEKAVRDQQIKDYNQASAEMTAAISALKKASSVLGTATEKNKQGVLLNVRYQLRKVLFPNKSHHVDYMERTMERALAPPKNKDWDKLDAEKSTFSKGYKGRSFKIQDTLAEMKKTFEENLAAADRTEELAKADYKKLREKKEETLRSRQTAAEELNAENAARDKTKEESQEEVDNLTDQVANDEKILAETSDTCAKKKEEYVERSRLRTEEVASIAEAISVLRSDDARDTFNSSFDSQTTDFLQINKHRHLSKGCAEARKNKAVRMLSHSASTRLRTVSYLISAAKPDTTKFPGNVIDKIDSILADLALEATTDEKEKNECEEFRAQKTLKAKNDSNDIDENTEEIGRQEEVIKKLDSSIEEKRENRKAIKKDMDEAEEQREKEHAEYQSSKRNDEDAVGLIEKAVEALSKFYSDNNLALLQGKKKAKATPPELEAGKAPPPPPGTWDESYGGQKEANTGVVAILTLIKEDVKKDIKMADEEEKKSEDLYVEFKTDSKAQRKKLKDEIDLAIQQRDDAKGKVTSEKEERDASKSTLAKLMGAIKAEEPKCNFISINFDVRKKNRNAEKDGLEKAKQVLKGANFGFLEC